MPTYKIGQKGGLVLPLARQVIKLSQPCPKCGAAHKEWAEWLAPRFASRGLGSMKQLGQTKGQARQAGKPHPE